MFVDIHVIQSVPPSNINRDDTGSPKTAYYGGVLRSRVSSQAWKKAVRGSFAGAIDQSKLGIRTKQALEKLADRMTSLRPDLDPAEAQSRAKSVIEALGMKVDEMGFVLDYGDRVGQSKMKVVKTIQSTLKLLIQRRWERITIWTPKHIAELEAAAFAKQKPGAASAGSAKQ